jgi:AsmA protein
MKWNSGRLWLRIIVYGSIAIVTIAVLTQALIFWQFDETAVRRSLSESLRDTGRQVQILGTVTPHVFPSPGLDVNRITISQQHSQVPFARIERLEARLAWWPLILFGKREVRTVALYGAEVQIDRLSDNTLSINDLLMRRAQKGFNINLNALLVHDGVIHYRDQVNDSSQTLGAITLEANGLKSNAELSASAILDNTQHPVHLSINTPLVISDKRISLSQVKAQLLSDTPQLGQTRLEATGDYFLDLNAWRAGGNNLSFEFSSERPHSKISLTVPQMDANLDNIHIPQSRVDGTLQYGRSEYRLAAKLSNLFIGKHSMIASNLTGEFNWKVGEHRFKLTLAAPFSLDHLTDLRMTPLSLTAQAITPLLPRGQLIAAMKGTLSGSLEQERLDLDGKGKLDGSDIALKVTQYGLMHPRHDASLSIGALDLNRYLPENKGEAIAVFLNPAPIPLDWLDFFDLNGSISAGELSVGRFRMKNVSTQVVVSPRELELNRISASIYSGHLQGDARLKRGPVPRLEVKQTLSGMSIRPLLVDLFNFGQLNGKGSGQVAISAQGQSFVDLRNSLSGDVQMSLNQGALSGIDLVSALKNLPAELKELDAPARANLKTTFSTLSAGFHLDQGVGRNQNLKLASQLVNVSGGGKVDLRHSIIDYTMDVQANPREFARLKGVNIPLKITGPLNAPVYALDFNAMVKGKKTETEKQQVLKQELKKQITTILP